MKRFLFLLALVAIVTPALLLANPQDTVWVRNTGHDIEALAVSPDSKYIAVGEDVSGAFVSIRDIQNGNELFQLPGWSYYPNMLFSKNGKYLLYGYDDTLRIADCSNWKVIHTLYKAGSIGRFTNDEKYIIFKNLGSKTTPMWLDFFNIETGLIEKQITKDNCPIFNNIGHSYNIVCHPVENKIYFVTDLANLYELNLETYQTSKLNTNVSPYTRLAISNDGTLLAFETNESETDKIIVMNTITKEIVCRVPGKNYNNVTSGITGLDFSSNGIFLAIGNINNNIIDIWEIISSQKKYSYKNIVDYVKWADQDKAIISSSGPYLVKYKTDSFSLIPDTKTVKNLYPNPTDNLVNITITLYKPSLLTIDLSDINGKFIKQCYNNTLYESNNTIQIDVSDLSTGEYLLQVNKESEILTYKLIINK